MNLSTTSAVRQSIALTVMLLGCGDADDGDGDTGQATVGTEPGTTASSASASGTATTTSTATTAMTDSGDPTTASDPSAGGNDTASTDDGSSISDTNGEAWTCDDTRDGTMCVCDNFTGGGALASCGRGWTCCLLLADPEGDVCYCYDVACDEILPDCPECAVVRACPA